VTPTEDSVPLHSSSTTAEPAVVRILAADGTVAPSAAAEPYLELVESLSDAELEGLYRDMVLIRAFDRQATNLQRQGQLALWPPSRGQEAAQVGSARAARAQDHVFPSYREHVVCTIRGVDPVDIIRLMRGMDSGPWTGPDPGWWTRAMRLSGQPRSELSIAVRRRRD